MIGWIVCVLSNISENHFGANEHFEVAQYFSLLNCALTFSPTSFSRNDLPVYNLCRLEDAHGLARGLDPASHHRAERGAHPVRSIMLAQFHAYMEPST